MWKRSRWAVGGVMPMIVAAVTGSGWLLLSPGSTLAFLVWLAAVLLALAGDGHDRLRWLVGAVLLLVVLPIAGVANSFLLELTVQIGIYAAMALGLNVVVGQAGLLDLGYAAFFAVGAYTWAIFGSTQAGAFLGGHFPLSGDFFYLFLFVAVLTTACVGVFIGLPALRLRGDYLAIVTLAMGEVVRVLANNLDHPINITNGPQGITPIARPSIGWFGSLLHHLGITVPTQLWYPLFFYLLVLVLIGLVTLVNVRLSDSPLGRAWVAIREDEVAARAMGIALLRTKLMAFATGAAFSGAMGVVFAAKQLFVSPESFTLVQSILILAMVILGGMGSIRGAIMGAALVTVLNLQILKSLSEYLNMLRQSGTILDLGFWHYDLGLLPTQLEPAKYERLVFGIILVLMMIFRPEGLLPSRRASMELHQGK